MPTPVPPSSSGTESTERTAVCLARFGERRKRIGGRFREGWLLPAAAAVFLAAPGARGADAPRAATAAAPLVYRIETAGQGALWSSDRPIQRGDLVLFHVYPAGTLMSVRRQDVKRIVADAGGRLRRGSDYVDVGITGPGSARKDLSTASSGKGAGRSGEAPPGARKDGTALLNPDRKYQPDIDSKQVPGLNLGYPASPNDYREGRTFGYPAAPAVQSAPGEPPKMPEPKGPN
jgi:hypothetical protein